MTFNMSRKTGTKPDTHQTGCTPQTWKARGPFGRLFRFLPLWISYYSYSVSSSSFLKGEALRRDTTKRQAALVLGSSKLPPMPKECLYEGCSRVNSSQNVDSSCCQSAESAHERSAITSNTTTLSLTHRGAHHQVCFKMLTPKIGLNNPNGHDFSFTVPLCGPGRVGSSAGDFVSLFSFEISLKVVVELGVAFGMSAPWWRHLSIPSTEAD